MSKENNIKKVLIIVDMINGFVKEGLLADPSIQSITIPILKTIKEYLNEDSEVITFQDCHTRDSLELEVFPPHCLVGTKEVELISELQTYKNRMRCYKKNSTNGFMVTAFQNHIKNLKGLEEITITGCCTDICVLNLALSLQTYFHETGRFVKVTVPENMVDTFHNENHDRKEYQGFALKLMRQAGIQTERRG